MTFSIEFIKETKHFLQGEIQIGNFKEHFEASISYWKKEDYLVQWKEALNRLIEGKQTSAVITSMYNPQNANFIIWWIFYKEINAIFVQNQILFFDKLSSDFDETDIYEYIPKRETLTEEGIKISEWSVSYSELEKFLQRLNE